MWGTPPHPPSRTSPLQRFAGFGRSDVLAGGRRSLVRYCVHTKQAPLDLNTDPTLVAMSAHGAVRIAR